MEVSGQLHAPDALHGTHCVGGWMAPRAGIDVMESYFCQKSNSDSSVVQPVGYSLYRLSHHSRMDDHEMDIMWKEVVEAY
jgi:hypothetical protein